MPGVGGNYFFKNAPANDEDDTVNFPGYLRSHNQIPASLASARRGFAI
ncbi:MAG: hypothetical protein ACI9S8_002704 [Chlamydiales bacterium]|jgi:hypothetical protein